MAHDPNKVWYSMDPATLPAEVRARLLRVIERAEQVFGNSVAAGVWMGRFDPAIVGGRYQIRNAVTSEPGMRDALSELDRLAEVTVPDTSPAWMRRRRKRWR